jgi:hypothetical protein
MCGLKNPIGGPIADAAETLRIDEGLRKAHRMSGESGPVGGYLFGHTPQEVRSQMLHGNPGQNQNPGVVSKERDILPPGCGRAADEAITAAEVRGVTSKSRSRSREV